MSPSSFTGLRGGQPDDITAHDIDRFIEYQYALGWRPATVRRRGIAVRMFFDYLAYARDQDIPNPVLPRRHDVAIGPALATRFD